MFFKPLRQKCELVYSCLFSSTHRRNVCFRQSFLLNQPYNYVFGNDFIFILFSFFFCVNKTPNRQMIFIIAHFYQWQIFRQVIEMPLPLLQMCPWTGHTQQQQFVCTVHWMSYLYPMHWPICLDCALTCGYTVLSFTVCDMNIEHFSLAIRIWLGSWNAMFLNEKKLIYFRNTIRSMILWSSKKKVCLI